MSIFEAEKRRANFSLRIISLILKWIGVLLLLFSILGFFEHPSKVQWEHSQNELYNWLAFILIFLGLFIDSVVYFATRKTP